MSRNAYFKILSLDGGGVRGIFSARVLDLMNRNLNIDVHKAFDLVVGTSTGSIVAAAVATGYDLSKLVEDYESQAPEIFRRKNLLSIFHLKSKYDAGVLENFLQDSFGEIRLGDIEVPLMINATNVSTGRVQVFKSSYQKRRRGGDYFRDGEIPLYKAVLASCSAPTYFDPAKVSDDLVCDGGLWANTPELVAYTEAISNFQRTPENMRILSIGTGNASQFYSSSSWRGLLKDWWGFLTGWKREKIVDFVMLSQSQYAKNCLNLIMPDGVMRINPEIEKWRLDDCGSMPTLKSLASSEVTNSGEAIKKFLRYR